ncbi:glycosyltransferase family 39 protein [Skermania sp. ID1734]|uniref:ArnT family glycosyltransferase n=1 Tax=Skermania sp. ID1734 TaxID=2597516 RepID=UPI00117D4796|nr:glycosyltransferase family 39 protein [Skermania sp. ID1734]TSD99917.1 glycosyltransferase family 39 protein [Skermania sp. ID1734]
MTITIDTAEGSRHAIPAAEPTQNASSRTLWERVGLVVLLIGTAVAYLWNITVNGMGNQFYAAAAQAGSKNWEALLFGSLDTGNFITVDKPPVSQWVMGLSGQIFGFSSASMLIPQALMAVASVALVYGAVARVSSRGAGLLAGAVLAVTPVAALMFRFNNPDAVMVLLMTAGAYCTVRALSKASARWLALAGVALGFAFLAKMLEGLMVLPALGLAYLIVAPTGLGKRIAHLLGAAAALVLSSGWYVAVTLLWPAGSRPYLAGSTDNNFMNLVIGYNGLARVLGRNHGGGFPSGGDAAQHRAGAPDMTQWADMAHRGSHGGFGGMGSGAGITRLFTGEVGFEISWLLPAALLSLVIVLVSRGRRPRTDLVRGAAIVFGGWLVVDGLVLSFMNGMMHAYYTLAIAPAIAGCIGLAVHELWRTRERTWSRVGAAGLVAAAGVWGFVLLNRNGDWLPWLRWTILAVTVVAAAAVLSTSVVRGRRFGSVAMIVGLCAALAGTTAYTLATLGQAHSGGGPTVGPAQSDDHGGGWGDDQQANPQLTAMLEKAGTKWSAAINRSSSAAGLELSSNTAVMAIGGFGGSDPTPTLPEFINDVASHQVRYYIAQTNGGPGQHGFGGNNGPNAAISKWVSAHFTPVKVGSATVYDLSGYRG